MTSDFEKRPEGSSGPAAGGSQSGFGERLPPGQSLPAVETAFGQRTAPGGTTYAPEAARSDESADEEGLAGTVGREARSAKAELGAAADTVRQGVSGLGEAVRDKAMENAEAGKTRITSSIEDFAAAVRKASDELGERDQSMAAGLVREVANGLEQATGAIHGKSVQDLSRSVAAFARRQPTTFLIGAALAGIALGRFARASGEHASQGSGRRTDGSSGRGRFAQDRYGEDLYENDGGDARTLRSGMTPGRSAGSRPVSPPVSAGTSAPRPAGLTSGSPSGSGMVTNAAGTIAGGSTIAGGGSTSGATAPAEGPSGAVLGHGSGSFDPQGDRHVR